MKSRMQIHVKMIRRSWRFFGLALVSALAAAVVALTNTRAESLSPTGLRTDPPAASHIDSSDSFGGLAVTGESELGNIRGGFSLAGLKMDFGANVRTFIDGVLSLETVVTMTGAGITSQQVTPPGGSVPNVPGLTLVFGDGSGSAIGDFIPPNVDLSGLVRGSGVVLNDSKGFTAVLHQINKDHILGMLVNAATGRTIRHKLDINVTVSNFRQFQQTVGDAKLATRLAGATQR